MNTRISRFAHRLSIAAVLTAALVSVLAVRAYASGPGAAASFVVLSDGVTDIATSQLSGDVGGFQSRLSDGARIKGSAIGAASFGIGLELGDNARVTGKCVTGGGSIDIVPQHPAKCRGGKDTSGSDPLLNEFSDGLDDADTLVTALSGLTPTLTQNEIDLPPGTKMKMKFPAGVNVVELPGALGRMLLESGSKLTIQAPKGSSVIFLIGGLFTTQSKAKVVLAGGIKAKNVAYVVDGDVTLGTRSSVIGTILAPTGPCMLDHKSALTGAIICESSVTFEGGNSVTFAPLRATFP